MRFSGFLLLLLLTALAGAGVYFKVFAAGEQGQAEASTSELLYPGFASLANEVAEIRLVTPTESMTVKRDDQGWTQSESGGYPVKLEVVKKLALSVAELRIEEAKTANPAYHGRLGVEAPETEGSNAKRLTFLDQAGETLAALIIGSTKSSAGSQGVFVRRDGEDQTWLCQGRVGLPYSTKAWMDTEVLRLDDERVESLHIQHADGQEIHLTRSQETPDEFELQDVPIGRQAAAEGNATSAATALSFVNFNKVRGVESIDFNQEPVAQSTYRCKDGLVLHLTSARQDGETWFKINARFEEPAAEATPAPGEENPTEETPSDETTGGEPAVEEEPAIDVAAEVAELNQRLGPWAFALPVTKAEQIAKPLEDLLQSLSEGDPESTPGFDMNEAGELPMELQQLLNAQGGGPTIPLKDSLKLPTAKDAAEELAEKVDKLEEPTPVDGDGDGE